MIHWDDIIGAQHLGPADIKIDWKQQFGLEAVDERSIGFGPLLKIGEEGILVQPIRLPGDPSFVDVGYVVIDIRNDDNLVVGTLSIDECNANIWDEHNSLGGHGWNKEGEPREVC